MTQAETVVSSVEEFRNAAATRLILAGELVFCSMRGMQDIPGFIPRPPLHALRSPLARLRAKAPKVHIAVNAVAQERPGVKLAYAIEGYINWGLRETAPGTRVLIGGGESNGVCNVSICVFSQGALTALEERRLPVRTSLDWEDSVLTLLAYLTDKYPGAKLHLAAPLPDWGVSGITYIAADPFKGLKFHSAQPRASAAGNLAFPLGLLLLSGAAYGGVLGYGYYLYEEKVEAYRTAARNPVIVKQGGIDEGALGILKKKEAFLNAPRQLESLLARVPDLAARLGQDQTMRLLELRLPADAPKDPGQPPADYMISVLVPAADKSRIYQAKDVMSAISARTGLTLRLVGRGTTESDKVTVFKMEALLPDPNKKGPAP